MSLFQHNFFDEYPHKCELVFMILLAFISITIYQIVPNLDLVVSDYFFNFDTQTWFINEDTNIFAKVHSQVFSKYLYLFIAVLLGLIFIYSFFDKDIKRKRNKLLFYLIAFGLSPVIFTAISKYYYQRPRPYIIQQYNPDYQQQNQQNQQNQSQSKNQNTKHIFEYVPAFETSKQCEIHNCSGRDTKSFFSGHTSRMAAFIIFIWFLTGSARFIAYNIFYALLLLTMFFRISTGNHFLSDCLVSFYITYFSIWLIQFIFYKFNINIK